jgi:SAM-dependent methyltransferase
MPRSGELTYYERIGQHGQLHAVTKPFSDPECGHYLLRVGALLNLLPPPPGRLLECGCGTGWLSYILARRGYDVVATDVAPGAIELAQNYPTFRHGAVPEFRVADAEQLDYDAEFDVVIFFDSLHHAVDELAALRGAFRALVPGGLCVMLEPGWGHHRKSRAVEEVHEVTEKDMPPYYLRRLGKQAGFRRSAVYPAPHQLGKALFPAQGVRLGWAWKLATWGPMKYLTALAVMVLYKRYNGITILHKPEGK